MLLLKNGKILENGVLVSKDILIDDKKIVKIDKNIQENVEKVLDLEGKFVSPGFIDVHVHWREPGFEYKENIYHASRAAARGGFTTAMPMPNLDPVPDNYENLKIQLDIIERDSVIRAIPYGAITKGELGKDYAEFEELVDYVFAFSSLIRGGCMHCGRRSRELDLPGIPSVCESVQIARDVLLAEAAGCHYHVCHVSTKESVRVVREAKAAGIKVTCEVCPHHLISDEMDIPEDNGMWKMNPPLRSREDRNALIAGLLDGTIDVIATDHAPHATHEKDLTMRKAAFGIVGSETAFSQLYTKFVKTGVFSLDLLVKLMTEKVADTFGLPYGRLEENGYADLVVIDLEKSLKIDPEKFLSKGRNTPYVGEEIYGIPVLTLSEGKVAYKDSEVFDI